MKTINTIMLVPDNLTLDGEPFDVSAPKFHAGQEVYIKDNSVYEWYQSKIIAVVFNYYTYPGQPTSLTCRPNWNYIIGFGYNQSADLKTESEIATTEEWLASWQEEINNQQCDLGQVAEMVVNHDLNPTQQDLDLMIEVIPPQFKEGHLVDKKQICQLYLNHVIKQVA